MKWYYTANGQQAGPVDETALASMARTGEITSETLVWREGMAGWATLGSVPSLSAPGGGLPGLAGSTQHCTECGGAFPPDELIPIGGAIVCAACKPIAVQKLREGVQLTGDFRYAGFWIRFCAKFVDGLILMAAQFALRTVLTLLIHPVIGKSPYAAVNAFALGMIGLSLGVRAFYMIWFTGKYGATPGKMACGLRVIRSSGEPVTYGRATGRFFAELLSSLTLLIGYIMAGFDEEKRALHDRICDTRVVYK